MASVGKSSPCGRISGTSGADAGRSGIEFEQNAFIRCPCHGLVGHLPAQRHGSLDGRKPSGSYRPGSIHQLKAIFLPMKTALQHYTSRTADKFVARLSERMSDRIAEVAKQHHRSMNS